MVVHQRPDIQDLRLPDFIIGGAPKCGTTSLHGMLVQHPDIGIPIEEVQYFDADDPIIHPDFLIFRRDGITAYDPSVSNRALLERYASRFAPFSDKRLIGEDSTSYLMSELAPARIKALLPDVKLIFMIRHPVRRAYSQYWHLVKSGRVTVPFERAVASHPSIVMGSCYVSGLRRFHRVFPRDQIKVVLFRDLRENAQQMLDEVTDFLGAARLSYDPARSWFNRTWFPNSVGAQLRLNHVARVLNKGRYADHFGDGRANPAMSNRLASYWSKGVKRLLLTKESPPPMNPSTEAYLTEHLTRRNEGIEEFVDRNLAELWPDMRF